LLRDSGNQFTSLSLLTSYINQARIEIAKRTASLNVLVTGQSPFGTSAQPGSAIPGAMVPGMLPATAANNANAAGQPATASNGFVTIPGVEYYSYRYAKPFLQAQYEGYDSIIYVSDISISWGGSFRPTIDWMPWGQLQAFCRSYSPGVMTYPSVWSQLGVGENGQVWVFPVPINSTYAEMEWQCVCTPKALNNNSDFEALPDIYHGCVKYYASYLSLLSQQRTGLSQVMRDLFEEQILINGVAGDWGHGETWYQTWP